MDPNPQPQGRVCFQKARHSSQSEPAAATLSASFLVTKLTPERHPGLCPGLTCSLFRFCSRVPAEPIYTAQCPPTDGCIQLQKPRLVELVFWLLFKAIVPVKPQGPSGMRSFGVDEWASPTVGLAVTPREGKGFGYLQFPPDRYVNYFLPRRFFQEHHLSPLLGLIKKTYLQRIQQDSCRILPFTVYLRLIL